MLVLLTKGGKVIDQDVIQKVVEFHGHMCPGLAMGIRAAEVGLGEIGPHAADEEVVAVVETDMCAVDAIQFLTGCTFGKGNLIHRDHGKNAYTFIRRSDGKGVRVSTRADQWGRPEPEWHELLGKIRTGIASVDERERFAAGQRQRSALVMKAPLEELYDIREVSVEAPQHARILASVNCASCGEPTMETRIRRLDGQELCLPCLEDRLAGVVLVAKPTRPLRD
jgi:formylmethanofuran dehydrogenase subunit E